MKRGARIGFVVKKRGNIDIVRIPLLLAERFDTRVPRNNGTERKRYSIIITVNSLDLFKGTRCFFTSQNWIPINAAARFGLACERLF